MIDHISILIIYTGGTIGMIKDKKSGTLIPFNFDGIYEQIPGNALSDQRFLNLMIRRL